MDPDPHGSVSIPGSFLHGVPELVRAFVNKIFMLDYPDQEPLLFIIGPDPVPDKDSLFLCD